MVVHKDVGEHAVRAPPAGLEPAATRLEGGSSIHLSYGSTTILPDPTKTKKKGGGMRPHKHTPPPHLREHETITPSRRVLRPLLLNLHANLTRNLRTHQHKHRVQLPVVRTRRNRPEQTPTSIRVPVPTHRRVQQQRRHLILVLRRSGHTLQHLRRHRRHILNTRQLNQSTHSTTLSCSTANR